MDKNLEYIRVKLSTIWFLTNYPAEIIAPILRTFCGE